MLQTTLDSNTRLLTNIVNVIGMAQNIAVQINASCQNIGIYLTANALAIAAKAATTAVTKNNDLIVGCRTGRGSLNFMPTF